MTDVRRSFIRFRAIIWTTLVLLTLLLALAVGGLRLLVPYAHHLQPRIEQWLSQSTGQTVQLGQVRGWWEEGEAQLALTDVQFTRSDGTPLQLDLMELSLDPRRWLIPGGHGGLSVLIVADRIVIERRDTGQWQLTGIDGLSDDQSREDLLSLLDQIGHAGFKAREVVVVDRLSGHRLQLNDLRLNLTGREDRRIIEGEAGRDGSEDRLRFSVELPEFDDDHWQWSGYADLRIADLAQWFEDWPWFGARPLKGAVDLALWVEADPQGGVQLRSDISLSDLTLGGHLMPEDDHTLVATRYALDRMSAAIELTLEPDRQWQLLIDDLSVSRQGRLWPETAVAIRRQLDAQGVSEYQIGSDFLRLQDMTDALVVLTGLPEPLRQIIYASAPHADLQDIRIDSLHVEWPMRIDGQLAFSDFSSTPRGYLAGLSGIAGEVRLAGYGGQLTMRGEQASIELPKILRWPLFIERLSAEVDWLWDGAFWSMHVAQMSIDDPLISSEGRLSVVLDEGRPKVDVQIEIQQADLNNAEAYWPVNAFHPRLVEWLDSALIEGELDSGSVVLFGDLDDWPFLQQQGVFEAEAKLSNTLVKYAPQWPTVRLNSATVRFEPGRILMHTEDAQSGQLDLSRIETEIANRGATSVELTARATGSVAQMLNYLDQTPLVDRFGAYLPDQQATGRGVIESRFSVPLTAGAPLAVQGHVDLSDASFHFPQWELQVADADGRVAFDGDGVTATGLAARYLDHPVEIDMAIGDAAGEQTDARIRVVADARLSLFERFLPESLDLLRIMPEPVTWVAEFITEEPAGLETGRTRFSLASTLTGSALNLPAPFAKGTDEPMAVRLETTLPAVDWLSMQVDDLMSFRLERAAGNWRADIDFDQAVTAVRSDNGLTIRGELDDMDLDGIWNWLQQWPSIGSGSHEQEWIDAIDVSVRRLLVLGRIFDNTAVSARRDGSVWDMSVRGDWGSGTIRIPISSSIGQPVIAEFDTLIWPDPIDRELRQDTDPSRLPPIQFIANRMQMNGIDFGEVSFATHPTDDGMQIEYYETRSERMAINARGHWTHTETRNDSDFAITLTAERLDDMLTSLGYQKVSENGQTILSIKAVWPGAPGEFTLEMLDGRLDLSVTNGAITAFDTGAGRLLGLINILPRRLLLDFSDVFEDGLAFDQIEGHFTLANGVATTESLLIDGPTLDIEIRGQTDLTALTTDTVIRVTPNVGGALPIVGAIAGGGPGAAAGMVLQNVIGKPFGKIAETFYQVSGDFDDPVIERITGREDVEQLKARYRDGPEPIQNGQP